LRIQKPSARKLQKPEQRQKPDDSKKLVKLKDILLKSRDPQTRNTPLLMTTRGMYRRGKGGKQDSAKKHKGQSNQKHPVKPPQIHAVTSALFNNLAC